MLDKKSKCLLWGCMVLCCSCVDNAYDLNKDIVMDVTIPGNKITLPVGNVKPIVLDSLIDVDDIDLLEKMNGVFCIRTEKTEHFRGSCRGTRNDAGSSQPISFGENDTVNPQSVE